MNKKTFALFLIPSILGVFLFMIPVKFNNEWTICVKIVADIIGKGLSGFLPLICVGIIVISALMSLAGLAKPRWMTRNALLEETFVITPVWVTVRVIAALFALLTYFGVHAGKEYSDFLHMITESGAGGFVLEDLLTVLVIIFAIAGLLLPLLLDFGLLEFVGALLTKYMRPLFKIPGRGAIDCVTSWIGDGTLGVMLTCNQYQNGYYSAREASVISTTFSAVSITFTLVIIAQVNMMEYFGIYYLCICLVGFVCALLLPRIPPLSLKKNTYIVHGRAMPETMPEGYKNSLDYAFHLAMERAENFQGVRQFMTSGIRNSAGMWFGVLPSVMTIGTLALLLANNTEIFAYLGKPFLPLLELLRVPEAEAAAKTMVVGFTDMFTPSIIAAGSITSPMTKFIVATVSVTQLIYLSEVGGLILASPLPVTLWELFLLFLERTVISLLVTCPIAHFVFQ